MKNTVFRARLAVLPLALSSVFPAFAQTEPTGKLQEVIVTATRMEQPVTDVVADVSTIDRAQIERMGATSVPQILSHLPGLQTISNGDTDRVYIRGADAYMTALYVDGVRVYSQDGASAIGGGVPWELIPVSSIERIEVLRGPASAVYGSDAMGGVIQIITRKGANGFRPYVTLGVGSHGLAKSDAGFSGAGNGWDYAAGVGYQSTDGINTRPDFVRTPNLESSKQHSSNLKLGYQVQANQRLELSAMESMVDSQFPFYDFVTVNELPAKGSVSNAALKWSSQWTDDYRTGLTLSRSNIAKRDTAPNDYETKLTGALFENYLKLGAGTLSAFLEQKTDKFSAQADAFFNPAFQGTREQNAVALGYGLHSENHALQVNLREDRDSLFGAHQTGALAYGYSFAEKWRVTASSGTAFKAPTLEQLFSQYGSTQLAPETNRSQELGLNFTDASSAFKAVVYHNEISNLISSSQTLATCTAGFFCYYNVGRATVRGVTFSGNVQLKGIEVRGSLDMLEPRDDITGRELSLRARTTATVGVDTELAGWQLGAELQHVGARFNEASNTNRLAAYDLLNLSASTSLAKDWKLVTRLDNATDQVYVQALGYDTSFTPTPIVTSRATYYVGLQWQL